MISADALDEALDGKNAFAERTDAQVYLVTQFCFEAALVVAWERAIRAADNRLPVRVGLPGVTSLRSLISYGRSCGVGASLRGLTRHGSSLARLTAVWTPDRLVATLAAYRSAEPHSLIEGVHLFPFGVFERTARWAVTLAEGRFTEDGDDLRIDPVD